MGFRWLVRWFPQFRALAAECDQLRQTVTELQGQNSRLEDRLMAASNDRNKLWESFQDSLKGERAAYQLHINMSMQRMGAGVPYPDAPHIPDHLTPAPSNGEPIGRRGRVLMSEMLQQRTDEILNKRFAVKAE